VIPSFSSPWVDLSIGRALVTSRRCKRVRLQNSDRAPRLFFFLFFLFFAAPPASDTDPPPRRDRRSGWKAAGARRPGLTFPFSFFPSSLCRSAGAIRQRSNVSEDLAAKRYQESLFGFFFFFFLPELGAGVRGHSRKVRFEGPLFPFLSSLLPFRKVDK